MQPTDPDIRAPSAQALRRVTLQGEGAAHSFFACMLAAFRGSVKQLGKDDEMGDKGGKKDKAKNKKQKIKRQEQKVKTKQDKQQAKIPGGS
jgi:hypothetical protein